MPDAPVLLSPERVAQIAADSEVYPSGCRRAVTDLLADRAAYRQQVATELAGLLRREPRKEDLLSSDELLALAFEQRREYNATIRAVASRLGIDLSTPTSK